MTQLIIGTIQHMQIKEKGKDEWILENEHGTALWPKRTANTKDQQNEQTVEVFIYKGENERATATTVLPEVEAGRFGWGIVKEIKPEIGAFVDIGTDFNIIMPRRDLPAVESAWPKTDDHIYLRLKKDSKDQLLAIPAKEHEWSDLLIAASDAELNDTVQGRILFSGKEGSVMITKESYRGFIHQSERDKELRLGEFVSGRVIEVKEDGTLNVSLRPMKHERMDDDAEKIFAYITANGGVIPLGNKSDPDLILNTFGMSKSAFKRAVGRLMKEGKIKPEDERIEQVKK